MSDSYVTDPNPFVPDVPDRIRELSPEVYGYLRDQAEVLRRTYRDSLTAQTAHASRLAAVESTLTTLTEAQEQVESALAELQEALDQIPDSAGAFGEINERIEQLVGLNKFSLSTLSSRVSRISEASAQLTFTNTLQAVANFAARAEVAGDNAESAAGRTFIHAQSTNSFTQSARVYRDQAGVFADSVTTMVLQAQVSQDQSKIQADLALTYSTTASTEAATATTQAALSATYAGNSQTSATNSATSAASASGHAATASTQATLAATHAGTASTHATNSQTYSVAASGSAASALASMNLAASYADTASANYQALVTADATETAARIAAINSLTTTVGGHTSSLTTQAAAIADVEGRTEAYFSITAIAGGRAQLTVYADGGGAGVDIVGDVRIEGDLIVTGSVTWDQMDLGSLGQLRSAAWSGTIATDPGTPVQALTAFTASMPVNPSGVFVLEVSVSLTPLYADYTGTYLGLPEYFKFVDDGGVQISCTDDDSNTYSIILDRPGDYVRTLSVLAVDPFTAVWQADAISGTVDNRVDQGDYYNHFQSQVYSISAVSAIIRWSAI
jgi:hypothetical protein